MKLAFVYDAVYPWVKGGVEKRVWELARRMGDNHDVHIYGLHYWDGPAETERDGVHLHGVAPPPADLYTDGRRSIPEALTFAGRLLRPLRRDHFDVIDCQEFPYFPCFSARLATLRRDTTLLMTWHEVWDDYWYEYLGYKGIFGQIVERAAARVPNDHIVVSERTQRDLHRLGVTASHRIPNGIDYEEIQAVQAAEIDIDVLFAGRLIKEKNVDLLLDAIDSLNTSETVKCVVIGDGPERERLERRTTELGLEKSVRFTGFLEGHDEVLALMQAATVFAVPSRREGFGIAVLEALACGTPVVTIQHPQNAVAELIDQGVTGYVCSPTPEAFARGLEDAREGISSQACRESAQQYDWDDIARRAEAVYRKAR